MVVGGAGGEYRSCSLQYGWNRQESLGRRGRGGDSFSSAMQGFDHRRCISCTCFRGARCGAQHSGHQALQHHSNAAKDDKPTQPAAHHIGWAGPTPRLRGAWAPTFFVIPCAEYFALSCACIGGVMSRSCGERHVLRQPGGVLAGNFDRMRLNQRCTCCQAQSS
jgi:hypothetical protein